MKQLALVLLAALLMVGCKKEEQPDVLTLKLTSVNSLKFISYLHRVKGVSENVSIDLVSKNVKEYSVDFEVASGDTIFATMGINGYAPLTGYIYLNGKEVANNSTQQNNNGNAYVSLMYVVN